MCGRFTQYHTWREVHAAMSIIPTRSESDEAEAFQPCYNIAPTNTATIFRHQDELKGVAADRAIWWFYPPWAKSRDERKYATFNARDDGFEKPRSMFRPALQSGRRCIFPIGGFYEWKTAEDKGKDAFYFHMADAAPFAVAGLYNDHKEIGLNATTVTVGANALVEQYHPKNRMAAILERDAIHRWLDPATPPDDAMGLLQPYGGNRLTVHRVSRDVNGTRNKIDAAHLIEPVSAQSGGLI